MSKYLSYGGLQKVWAKIKSLFLPLSGGTMSNTNKVVNLNADLLDGYHSSDFNQKIHFSGYQAARWFKININVNYGCMISLTVKVSGSYRHRTLNIGGYNYVTNKGWYLPTAFCLGSSDSLNEKETKVVFGKDEDGEIWFAVWAGSYNSVEISNAQFYWSNVPADRSTAFSCTLVDPANVNSTFEGIGTTVTSIRDVFKPTTESDFEEIATTWINSNCI